MLFDSHGGVEQGLGDGVGTPSGVPDENIQEFAGRSNPTKRDSYKITAVQFLSSSSRPVVFSL